MEIRRRNVKLTDEQKARHAEIRREIEADKPRLKREAMTRKAERVAIMEAFALLKAERQRRGLSLHEIARRTGIDASNLSKLENDPYPNPTLGTLLRIAEALEVKLTIGISQDAA